jgi:hypothetical protein
LPAEAKEIWKDIWHEEAHHSTAMEGNTLVGGKGIQPGGRVGL